MRKNLTYFLLMCFLTFAFSCIQEELTEQHSGHAEHATKMQRVSFDEMSNYLKENGVTTPKSLDVAFSKDPDSYITTIDSTSITQITLDDITTFTMRINTPDDSHYAFSNLIIELKNGITEEYIYHYNPTEEWQSAYDAGKKASYEGELTITDVDGTVVFSGKSTIGTFCYMAVDVPCYGLSCPCTDGNGQIIIVKVDCNGGSGGGGGDPGDGPTTPTGPGGFGTYEGGGNSTSTDPKCNVSKTSIANTNNILKNPEVKTKMDDVLKSKRNATNEFAVSVGKNGNSYNVTPPKEGDQHSGNIPAVLSGNYVADGHSHPNGSYGTPSAGDFYNFILRFPASPYLESRFVYGSYFGDAEVYALVVYNKTLAQNFVNAYPKSTNYNDTTAGFLQGSTLGNAYTLAIGYANGGTYQNTTDEYYSSSAMAMAYVLDKFNTGISLAKVDADGNLKRVIVTEGTITVSGGTGTSKTGLKITKCS